MATSSLSALPQGENDHVVLEMQPTSSHTAPTYDDAADRVHTSDEEAACRVCLDSLSEGGETLLLECSCRGELALAHKECAIKWFSRKDNNTCDVCRQVIQNLPLDLLTISNTTTAADHHHAEIDAHRFNFRLWQEDSPLLIASMFVYFFFLLKFLARYMGDTSIIASLLFACILGHLSAWISTRMAIGIYLWLYAILEFTCVVMSAFILRWLVKWNMLPIIIIFLATIVGFGVALCCGLTVMWALRLRAWWLQQHQQGANTNN